MLNTNLFLGQDSGLGVLLWVVRAILVGVGGWATSRGYTDEETWKTIAAGALGVVGLLWSFVARQQALATSPR